jgi:hypothetical protein
MCSFNKLRRLRRRRHAYGLRRRRLRRRSWTKSGHTNDHK